MTDQPWKVWFGLTRCSLCYAERSIVAQWLVRLNFYCVHTQSTRAVVDTFVRTKFLQLYSRQGTVQAYRAYKNRPSPKLTCLPFLDLVLNLVQI
eukprot:SAG11_NODE_58_length_19205_cov_30.697315_20_plen_93_part_01